MIWAQVVNGQEIEVTEDEVIRPPFESAILIDNQTTVVPIKGTLEFNIQHRFGTWKKGYDDLYGLWAPSNIRLALSYVPVSNLAIGTGLTKNQKVWDWNIKYTFLNQTRSGRIPVSVAFYGNLGISTQSKDLFDQGGDRLSYFSQLLISRKVTYWLSMQVAPSMTHFNFVNSESRYNDHFAVSALLRARFRPSASFIMNVDQPMTVHKLNNPNPNLAFGVELATSGHAFQIFVGNYSSIAPQYNQVYNANDFLNNEFLIGFNITRLWNL